MKTIEEAIQQLERSERGQMTCKLLKDFLASGPVKFLGGSNSEAVTVLITFFMMGNGAAASKVMEKLEGVIERNQWVEMP